MNKLEMKLREEFIHSVESIFHFEGTDLEEPRVCSEFGCPKHLTHEEQLYGSKCINHQHKEKINPSLFISYPSKQQSA